MQKIRTIINLPFGWIFIFGTGAVVLGGILIGDNVNIGANAIVVEDVPSNCTICSPKAQIVKYHNK